MTQIPLFSEYASKVGPKVKYPAKDINSPYATLVAGSGDHYPEDLVEGDITSGVSGTYGSHSVILYPIFDMSHQDAIKYWAEHLGEYHPYEYTNLIYICDPDWKLNNTYSSYAPTFNPSADQKEDFLNFVDSSRFPISGFVDVVVPNKVNSEYEYDLIRVKSPGHQIGYEDAYKAIRNRLIGIN